VADGRASVEWALGLRGQAPDVADAAVTAGIRLDDALRAYLAEQGSKRMAKEDLWMLVMSTLRLRLTAHALAMLRDRGASAYRDAPVHVDEVRAALRHRAVELSGFYERIAAQVGRPDHERAPLAAIPPPGEPAGPARPAAAGPPHHHHQTLWVREYLHHLGEHAAAVPGPALHVAELRRLPWWR
jgi:hypothetical protein